MHHHVEDSLHVLLSYLLFRSLILWHDLTHTVLEHAFTRQGVCNLWLYMVQS